MEAPAARPFVPAMQRALDEARACLATGDVPVGAVVLDRDGAVVATGRNEREARQDPTAHARDEAFLLAMTVEPQRREPWQSPSRRQRAHGVP